MTTALARTIHNPIQRDTVTFLKTVAETNGELTLVDVELAPGGGNGLHYHTAFTERFAVIEGELTIQLGTEQRVLRSGESAIIPVRAVHRFFNPSPHPVRFYTEIRPGHAGFERGMRIAYGLAGDGETNRAGVPRSVLALALVVTETNTALVGPLAILTPIFGLLARLARRRGVDQRLVARYAATQP
jgi:mannose-6-phosphate isomerase-like protein (cupin superfamily)